MVSEKQSEESLKKRVVSGLSWLVGLRAVAQLYSWVITLIVIRLLSPADYGLKALAGPLIGVLLVAGAAGMTTSLVQTRNLTETTIRSTFGFLLLANGVLAIVIALSAPFLANFYGEPYIKWIIWALIALFVIKPFQVIPLALLSRRLEYKRRSIATTAGTIVGSSAMLGLAFAGYGVWALVLGQLILEATKTILLNVFCYWPKRPSFSLHEIRQLLSYGLFVVASSTTWHFCLQLDVLVGGRFYSAEVIGLYAVGLFLARLPATKILPLLHQVSMPAYSKVQHDKQQVRWYFMKSVSMVSLVTFPMFFGIAALSAPLVELLFGTKWMPAAEIAVVIALASTISSILHLLGPMLHGLGLAKVDLRLAIVSTPLMLASLVLMAPFGVMGLAVGWSIGQFAGFIAGLVMTKKALGIMPKDVLMKMLPATICGALMFLMVLGFSHVAGPVLENWALVLLAVAIGAAAYVTSVRIFFPKQYFEFIGVFRK